MVETFAQTWRRPLSSLTVTSTLEELPPSDLVAEHTELSLALLGVLRFQRRGRDLTVTVVDVREDLDDALTSMLHTLVRSGDTVRYQTMQFSPTSACFGPDGIVRTMEDRVHALLQHLSQGPVDVQRRNLVMK